VESVVLALVVVGIVAVLLIWRAGGGGRPPAGRGESFRTRVVGVSHRNDNGSSRQEIVRGCSVGEALRLVREPENPHDPNAIRVCTRDGDQIGFLAADVAARLAPRLDAGAAAKAEIIALTGGTRDKPTRGVNIEITIARR